MDDGTEASAACATKLKVLADRTRLAVLQTLLHGPRCVSDLSERLGVEQSLLSHHLRVLRDADLVEGVRSGKNILYQLAHPAGGADRERTIELGCCRLSFAEDPSADPGQDGSAVPPRSAHGPTADLPRFAALRDLGAPGR